MELKPSISQSRMSSPVEASLCLESSKIIHDMLWVFDHFRTQSAWVSNLRRRKWNLESKCFLGRKIDNIAHRSSTQDRIIGTTVIKQDLSAISPPDIRNAGPES